MRHNCDACVLSSIDTLCKLCCPSHLVCILLHVYSCYYALIMQSMSSPCLCSKCSVAEFLQQAIQAANCFVACAHAALDVLCTLCCLAVTAVCLSPGCSVEQTDTACSCVLWCQRHCFVVCMLASVAMLCMLWCLTHPAIADSEDSLQQATQAANCFAEQDKCCSQLCNDGMCMHHLMSCASCVVLVNLPLCTLLKNCCSKQSYQQIAMQACRHCTWLCKAMMETMFGNVPNNLIRSACCAFLLILHLVTYRCRQVNQCVDSCAPAELLFLVTVKVSVPNIISSFSISAAAAILSGHDR